jgi:hypothetical protein
MADLSLLLPELARWPAELADAADGSASEELLNSLVGKAEDVRGVSNA